MTIVKGYAAGLVFRADADNSTYYDFEVDYNGNYTVLIWTGHTSPAILDSGVISNFRRGLGQSNVMAAAAVGDRLNFWANGNQVTFVKDDTYKQGQIGVEVVTDDNPGEALFRNAELWKL
jgi:hypothetical protein